jgi:PAS domain S-box-containing protein
MSTRKLNEEAEQQVAEPTLALEHSHGQPADDIGGREQAERELRAQTAFFEAQANSTVDGILVVDNNGQTILRNRRFTEIMNIPQDLLETKDDGKLLRYVAGKIKNPGEFLEKVSYLYHHPNETCRDEIEFADGMVLDRYSAPVVGKDGTYYGRIWTFRDITERKRSEDALRQLSLAVEQSPVSVVITDPQGNISYVNRKFTECTGYSDQEVIGQNPRILKSGSTTPDDYKNLWETITRGGEWRGEFHNKKKNGELYRESATITPIKDAQGSIMHFLAVKEDITERKQAEEALRDRETRVNLLLASTAEAIFGLDLEGNCTFANRACLRMLGYYDERELLGKNTHQVMHHTRKDGSPFPAQECSIYRAFHQGRGTHVNDEVLWRADGSSFPAEYWSHPIHRDGKIIGAVVTFLDITERKHAEQLLRASEKRYKQLFERNLAGVFQSNLDGTILDANESFLRLFHYRSREELLAAESRPLYCDQAARDSFLAVLKKQKRISNFELSIRRKDGSVGWILTNATLVDGEDLSHPCIEGTVIDITERKRTEAALRESEEQFRQLAETIREVFFLVTPEPLRMIYVSPAYDAISGRPREELYRDPRAWMAYVHPDDQERAAGFLANAVRDTTAEAEYRILRPDGALRWIRTRTFPVHNAEGRFYRVVGIAEDITERRSLEDQLRQVQKLEAIGQLAAGIAHEINTPTQFVSDNVTFLQDSWKSAYQLLTFYRSVIQDIAGPNLAAEVRGAVEEAEHKADLEFIASEIPRAIEQARDGVQRVAKIVRAMKEFSHPDSVERVAIDINRAIEMTVTVARNEWKYVAEMETDFDSDLPSVACYAGELNQVILNLIVNAAHAIRDKNRDGEKGRITIRTRARGDSVEIAVTDTGTGIPEAIRSRVFDPFFTTKEVGKGTGQGLALAHSVVVKKHGGNIWFETETGRGTTFFLHLPINPPSREEER